MIVLLAIEDADRVQQPAVRELARSRLQFLAAEEMLGGDTPSSVVVMEEGDSAALLSQRLGFDVLAGRYSDWRYHDREYAPTFETIDEHLTCFETVFVLSDYGDGVIVLVPKQQGIDPDLLAMCAMYAVPAKESSS